MIETQVAIHGFRELDHALAARRVVQRREIVARQRQIAPDVGEALSPCTIDRARTRAGAHRDAAALFAARARGRSVLDPLPDAKQPRLIPVLRIDRVPLEEPVTDGQQVRCTRDDRLLGDDGIRCTCGAGLPGDRRVLEERLRAQLDPGAVRFRQYPDAQERVAAELEEIVIDADDVESEHIGPEYPRAPSPFRSRAPRPRPQRGALAGTSAGSAARSILPFGNRGSACTNAYRRGTMCSGNRRFACSVSVCSEGHVRRRSFDAREQRCIRRHGVAGTLHPRSRIQSRAENVTLIRAQRQQRAAS